jgi:hypothetical protein
VGSTPAGRNASKPMFYHGERFRVDVLLPFWHETMIQTRRILQGDWVTYPIHGVGQVIEAWGNFHACGNCFAVCLPGRPTESCNSRPIAIRGRGIFDVRFADGLHSINKLWLRKTQNFEQQTFPEQAGPRGFTAAGAGGRSAPSVPTRVFSKHRPQ